ncbi:MAG: Holliday junction resolvase RuvX [Acidimicrobiales bacterium]
MRVLAVDLGERRIGVALSDAGGILASPYTVIERSGNAVSDREQVLALIDDTGAELVVVGLPLSLSGERGVAARKAAAEADELAAIARVPVELFDERLTTVEATRRRRSLASRSLGPGRAPRRLGRKGIDAEAAAVLLEAWLDAHRSRA